MNGRVFFDTNVLVYMFDRSEPAKRERAEERFKREGLAGNAVVSTQVLQEFYVIATHKLDPALEPAKAYDAVKDLCALSLVHIHPDMVLAAIRRSQTAQLSFWDSLIVEAAVHGQCQTLLSEDLQDGQVIDGVRIEDPFRAPAAPAA
jgi:predicted nucleic acid-binding protein